MSADEHAHAEDENEGRTATKPLGSEYKVRLASSVRMIEKDEVIRRQVLETCIGVLFRPVFCSVLFFFLVLPLAFLLHDSPNRGLNH